MLLPRRRSCDNFKSYKVSLCFLEHHFLNAWLCSILVYICTLWSTYPWQDSVLQLQFPFVFAPLLFLQFLEAYGWHFSNVNVLITNKIWQTVHSKLSHVSWDTVYLIMTLLDVISLWIMYSLSPLSFKANKCLSVSSRLQTTTKG